MKNYVVKHIESDNTRQKYQTDTVYLTDCISNDAKYLLMMVDSLIKFECAILMKNKKVETILNAFKQWLTSYLKPKILHI